MLLSFRRSVNTCATLYRLPRASRDGRTQQIRSIRRRPNISSNPGVQHRLTAMKNDSVEMDTTPDMDFFENSESDFFNVGSAYRRATKELAARDELTKLQIVKQKYFKEEVPNFLSWSEKEHIRYLNRKNPEEWTPEIIADSFPTTLNGAKKLLKVVWKPASQSRIDRHDASALRNWKELKENSLEGITPELKAHILKFSKRVIPPRHKSNIEETKVLSSQNTGFNEYSSILTRYENSTEPIQITEGDKTSNNQLQIEGLSSDVSTDVIRMKSNITSQPITLDDLRSKITQGAENNMEISLQEKLIISPYYKKDHFNSNAVIPEVPNTSVHVTRSETQVKHGVEKADQIQPYPERIRIPKKAYKKGVTYKVNDCFYDDDGRFLYRVPGLLSQRSQN